MRLPGYAFIAGHLCVILVRTTISNAVFPRPRSCWWFLVSLGLIAKKKLILIIYVEVYWNGRERVSDEALGSLSWMTALMGAHHFNPLITLLCTMLLNILHPSCKSHPFWVNKRIRKGSSKGQYRIDFNGHFYLCKGNFNN